MTSRAILSNFLEEQNELSVCHQQYLSSALFQTTFFKIAVYSTIQIPEYSVRLEVDQL